MAEGMLPNVDHVFYNSFYRRLHRGSPHVGSKAFEAYSSGGGLGGTWSRPAEPFAIRSLSHRLAKGFNEVVNGFPDDGLSPILGGDGMEDVTIMVKNQPGAIVLRPILWRYLVCQSIYASSSFIVAESALHLESIDRNSVR